MRRVAQALKGRSVCFLMVAWLVACGKSTGQKDEGRMVAGGGPRFGELMEDVGRRFERVGRATAAHRWELATFELGELDEDFDDVPTAKLPEDVHEEALRPFIKSYTSTALRSALVARDGAAVASAYAGVAKVCNACHQANARGFVEVPSTPGAAVPVMDPVP